MTFQHGVLVGGAAFLASGINAGAGGGSFISFPAILAAGIAPISANATNNTAMWVGGLSSTGTLRSELTVERKTLIKMLGASIIGSILGAVVLLRTSNSAFTQFIPLLLPFSTLLFICGPAVIRAVRCKRIGIGVDSPAGLIAQFAIAVYGGSSEPRPAS